jgi:hypothetical protein
MRWDEQAKCVKKEGGVNNLKALWTSQVEVVPAQSDDTEVWTKTDGASAKSEVKNTYSTSSSVL